MRASDFYTETVLPTLAERLDQAFPEFGWRRDTRGWVATNEQHTHARLGARAERVVAHGPAPRGFLVHGGDPMLWTAYINGDTVPRGADFVRAVRKLAERAGVDPSPLDHPSRATDVPTCCATSSTSAGASSPRRAVPTRGRTSSTAASLARRLPTRVSASSPLRRGQAGCSSGPATGRRRSPTPVSSATRAGPAGSAEPGETATAGSARSGPERSTMTRPSARAIYTSAAPTARTFRPTVSPTCLPARPRRGGGSSSSKASWTSTTYAHAGSRTSPPSAEPL